MFIHKDTIEEGNIESFLNTSLAAPGALAHRLQCCTACKIQNGRQGAPKWLTGFEKWCTPWLSGAMNSFC